MLRMRIALEQSQGAASVGVGAVYSGVSKLT
jgi:hypothetical protein